MKYARGAVSHFTIFSTIDAIKTNQFTPILSALCTSLDLTRTTDRNSPAYIVPIHADGS